jgi:hypothetical protein
VAARRRAVRIVRVIVCSGCRSLLGWTQRNETPGLVGRHATKRCRTARVAAGRREMQPAPRYLKVHGTRLSREFAQGDIA